MAKKPRQESSELFNAIEFCSLANNSSPDLAYTEHCCLSAETGTVYMSDGIVSCGCICPLEITANPHVNKLFSALKRMKHGHSLTLLDNKHLTIKSGRLKAVIPTIEYVADKLYPDRVIHSENIDAFLWALKTASIVTKDKADRLIHASVLGYQNSCYGTDNILLIECWHGLNLQQELTVPKTFITAIDKIKKKPTGLGYSDKSLTIWFEDNSWMRTQMYDNCWPLNSINNIFKLKADYSPIPEGLQEGLDSLIPFLENDNSIILSNNMIYVKSLENIRSTYELDNLNVNDLKVNCKLMKLVAEHATEWDTQSQADRYVMFVGKSLRGMLCLMV